MTKKVLALDTETTGLRSFHDDRLFSIIIADDETEYYFNFNDNNKGDRARGIVALDRSKLELFKPLFEKEDIEYATANAKFDLHMLARDGLFIRGSIWDVLVMARLERNDHFKYSLDECAKRIGKEKSDTVKEWISKNKQYKKVQIPGKKGEQKIPQFSAVPFEIIEAYAKKDARVTYDIYTHQKEAFKQWNNSLAPTVKTIDDEIQNEKDITRVCFDIERRGILLDVPYVKLALEHEQKIIEQAKADFLSLSKKELVDSNKSLDEVFSEYGIESGETEKGAVSYTEKVLSESDHELAKILLRYRDANKRASNYYSSFLYHADSSDVVHVNFRQSGTTTGRFSITDPALQTLTAEDDVETEFKVRRSFIPRPNFILVAIDYKAFEFRAMLDTAGEKELAEKITSGLDPHQATAELVGITRKYAKTLNFGLLYGMGVGKLAASLGCTIEDARRIKHRYFSVLPKVRQFINSASTVAAQKQVVVSRFGRPYRFSDPKWSYKAANCLIQGGTASAVKKAMVDVHRFLEGKKSGMILQIHDEILFEVHTNELDLIDPIKDIMASSWPEKFHKMDCSVEYSERSWADMEEYGEETRISIQKACEGETKTYPELGGIQYRSGSIERTPRSNDVL